MTLSGVVALTLSPVMSAKLLRESSHQRGLGAFIDRNYAADEGGRWYFQNGPQRVYVKLAYTPLVVHYVGQALVDHCGREFASVLAFQDDEGSVLLQGERAVALLDDRDLERYADRADELAPIRRADVEARFHFVADPQK